MIACHLIWAQARNKVIGFQNTLPWSLPEDLAYFQQMTRGQTVLMGSKTYHSLPESVRPLPNRRNVVLSRNPSIAEHDAVDVVSSLQEARDLLESDLVWVIGGSSIYEQTISIADKLYVTEIDIDCDGDTYAPEISDEWVEDEVTPWVTSENGLDYRFLVYKRRQDSK